jgi:predicted nucleic acid-binding protein
MPVVVDASAAAAVIFGEPEGATVAAHVRDETLIAPPLIDYELANVGWSKIRRSPERRAEVLAALSIGKAMPITRVAVDITAVLELALRTRLTIYDAAYLWLAMSRDVELVTLDKELARVNEALREPA